MSIEDIFLFFLSPAWQNIVSILKPVCLLAIVIFLLAILWVMTKSKWLYWYFIWDSQDLLHGEPAQFSKKAQEAWSNIRKKALSRKEAEQRVGIREGEKIVEDVLFKMGYKGDTMREKLEAATEAQIPNLEELSVAAEIYNNIVSNPDYRVTRDQARSVFNAFENFLKYFEYL